MVPVMIASTLKANKNVKIMRLLFVIIYLTAGLARLPLVLQYHVRGGGHGTQAHYDVS